MTENETVYMDSEDDTLYFEHSSAKGKFDLNKIFGMKGVSTYEHEKIIYRVTNPNELVSIALISNKRSSKLKSKSNATNDDDGIIENKNIEQDEIQT